MKKAVSLALAAVLAASCLAGCGSKKETDTFYIGGIGPTTGDASIYGNAVKNAAQIAVDEINDAGGINGYKIAFKYEDDQNDTEKSVNAYNTLKDWGMQALMGTVTSMPCMSVGEKTAADQILQLTPSGSSADIPAIGDNIYQVCFTDPNQGTASAQYIANKKLAKKVGIIYNSSDTYSSGVEKTFVAEAENQGFQIVAEEAFTNDSNTDFSTQLQKCQSAGAELVFMPFYYKEASIVLTQADQMGYAPKFFGVDGMDGILSVENFDTSLAENLMLLTVFAADAEDEATQNFVGKYKEQYSEVPNQFAADAYDAMYVIKAALEAADCTPDMSAQDICAACKDVMKTLSVDGLTGTGMTWNEAGEVSKDPKGVIIKDGVYVSMDNE